MSKSPTLDTAPYDLAHAPEVPHHRFSVFNESGEYAYARGLEVNPSHLPIALDAMRKSGWHLVSLFGETDSKHVGFIFRREDLASAPGVHQAAVDILVSGLGVANAECLKLRHRVDELLRANNQATELKRAAKRQLDAIKTHMRRMQDMTQQYLTPGTEPYIAENGEPYIETDAGFIHDMIYMLDGPEQREVLPDV